MNDTRVPLYKSELTGLPLLLRGKVRDVYEVDHEHALIVATDRISAFDVVLPTPIPGKGAVLQALSRFWFKRTQPLVRNHLVERPLEALVADETERARLAGRSMVVKRAKPLPIEAVVRGYLVGSGWRDYQEDGRVCGIQLPWGLQLASPLETPIFTPSTKARDGEHDANISFDESVALVGATLAEQIREISLALYSQARKEAADRGIIIADTKFEFGLDTDGELILIDELLTPDSSRLWPAATYRAGINPPSFDKQFVRDYLETLDWNKEAPAPELPPEIVKKTAEKYQEIQRRLIDDEP